MIKGGRESSSHDFSLAEFIIGRSSESKMGMKPSKTVVGEEDLGGGGESAKNVRRRVDFAESMTDHRLFCAVITNSLTVFLLSIAIDGLAGSGDRWVASLRVVTIYFSAGLF